MAKQYKSHKEVPAKYKWDLSFLLNGKTIEEKIAKFFKEYKKLVVIKDSKYNSKEEYLKYLKFNDKLVSEFYAISNYVNNSISLNVSDDKANSLNQQISFETYKISQELGAEDVRFFANSKKIKEWIKDKKFETWKSGIEAKLEEKKHQLPKVIQEFRVQESRADISAQEVFSILTNTELDFGYATTSKGKKIKVTNANRVNLSKHKDPKVRKTAEISYKKGYLDHKATLSNLIFQHFKNVAVWSKLEKFNSPVESLIFSDRVPVKLLDTLYKVVEDNMDLFRKGNKLHKQFYKSKFGKAITRYDYNVDLVDIKNEYTVDEAIKLVSDSVKPFGEDYHKVVTNAFNDNWVDFYPIKNKRGGAYSIGGTYSVEKKLICMNFNGTFRSVETLAHEMGHSMHSYFSDLRNEFATSQYPIFVAEIASIFNELMLFDHVLNTTKDDKLKFNIRKSMADGFASTVHRQVMWSKYERDLYAAVGEGQPLSTYESISKFYYESTKQYLLNPKTKYKPENQYPSIYVPHFYYGFYVYKYAIGQLVANIFFAQYKKEGPKALKNYIDNFLSAGTKHFPIETLKRAGVDLTDPNTYKLGFDAARDNLVELEKLGKKLFKK